MPRTAHDEDRRNGLPRLGKLRGRQGWGWLIVQDLAKVSPVWAESRGTGVSLVQKGGVSGLGPRPICPCSNVRLGDRGPKGRCAGLRMVSEGCGTGVCPSTERSRHPVHYRAWCAAG